MLDRLGFNGDDRLAAGVKDIVGEVTRLEYKAMLNVVELAVAERVEDLVEKEGASTRITRRAGSPFPGPASEARGGASRSCGTWDRLALERPYA
jgi:hypothetical protein